MKNILRISMIGLSISMLSCSKNEKTNTSSEHDAEPVEITNETNYPKTTASFSKQEHNFGNLKKGQVVQYVYEISNTGDNPLYITGVSPACGCTAPDYTKEPIEPGKKGQVTLSFDSKNFSGPVTKTAQVFTNTENSPIIISFEANVQ